MKLTKEQLEKVEYVSMADFIKRFDEFESIDDKLAFTSRYLITYGINGGEQDYSLKEAIQIAQRKIYEASMELRNKIHLDEEGPDPADLAYGDANNIVNPYAEELADDNANAMFMGNPVGYLKGYTKKLSDEISAKNWLEMNDAKLKVQCGKMLNYEFDDLEKTDFILLAQEKNTLTFKAQLESIYGSREALNRSVDKTKPGFFSKMFDTSSLQTKNLNNMWKAFNNPNHALYGDTIGLERAANEYVKHRFPDWKPGDPLPDISNLSGTEKARTELSINIIKACKIEKDAKLDKEIESEFDVEFKEMVAWNGQRKIKFEDCPIYIPGQKQNDNNIEQDSFQDSLSEDLDEAQNNNIIENVQNEKHDNEIVEEIDLNESI